MLQVRAAVMNGNLRQRLREQPDLPVLPVHPIFQPTPPFLEQHETPEFLPVSIDPTTKLAVQIDGQPIQDLKSNFREQSIAFDFTLPSDNLFNAEGEGPFNAGTYSLGVDDEIYVMCQAPFCRGLLHSRCKL